MKRLWSFVGADYWRAAFLLILLVGGVKGGWDFYWWNQWLRIVSWQVQEISRYIGQPVAKLPSGESLSRGEAIDLLVKEALKRSQQSLPQAGLPPQAK